MPSEYILREIQPREGVLKNVPYFVGKKNGIEIFQYDFGSKGRAIGTYFRFGTNGKTILVVDHGDWSHAYTIHEKLSSHIELTYLVPKPLVRDFDNFKADITGVDNVVLKLVQSFQTKLDH